MNRLKAIAERHGKTVAQLAIAWVLANPAVTSAIVGVRKSDHILGALPAADRVYLTRVHGHVAGDRAMPDGWLAGFELAGRDDEAGADGPLPFSFLHYRRAAR